MILHNSLEDNEGQVVDFGAGDHLQRGYGDGSELGNGSSGVGGRGIGCGSVGCAGRSDGTGDDKDLP